MQHRLYSTMRSHLHPAVCDSVYKSDFLIPTKAIRHQPATSLYSTTQT